MSEECLSLEVLLISRTYLYEMFHKTFGGNASEELIKTLSDKNATDVAEEYSHVDSIMGNFVSLLKSINKKTHDKNYLESLKDEYTRLFIGPNSLPALPWKSPYISREKVLFHEQTLLVRESYKAHGLKPKQYLHVPDDHISIMNGFISLLAQKSIALFREGKYQNLRTLMMEQKSFVDEHLNSWLNQFSEKLRKADRTGFYATFAEANMAFCLIDSIFINEAIIWLEENTNTEISDSDSEVFQPILAGFETLKSLQLLGLEDNELQEV